MVGIFGNNKAHKAELLILLNNRYYALVEQAMIFVNGTPGNIAQYHLRTEFITIIILKPLLLT